MSDDPDFDAWEADVRTNLVPKLRDSACTVSLVSTSEPDAKIAVELGLSLLLDKPIIFVVLDGAQPNENMRRVARKIIETDDITSASEQIHAALVDVLDLPAEFEAEGRTWVEADEAGVPRWTVTLDATDRALIRLLLEGEMADMTEMDHDGAHAGGIEHLRELITRFGG